MRDHVFIRSCAVWRPFLVKAREGGCLPVACVYYIIRARVN